ncbi:class D sortase [Metabacillus sp. BG109]|uniref:Class D sortase n=2 Tax=Metabacillus bambusae TaxID=2795218 RepID=A0ABS3N2U9_9BACI|nr:class D sortase [Metabacillus bambusae]
MFSYYAYWTWVGLNSTDENIDEQIAIAKSENKEALLPVVTTIPQDGEKLGSLSIPKLKQTFPIFFGDSETILKKGIGHIRGTALPGEASNSVLAGHRDTFFRHLDQLVVGDKLIVERSSTYYIYKIKKIRIVDNDDNTVIVPKPRHTLTLITCYPFTFIGPAPQRYIIEAELFLKPKMESKKQ